MSESSGPTIEHWAEAIQRQGRYRQNTSFEKAVLALLAQRDALLSACTKAETYIGKRYQGTLDSDGYELLAELYTARKLCEKGER